MRNYGYNNGRQTTDGTDAVGRMRLDKYRENANEETLSAIREVESGVDLETLDMDNFDEYVASL